MLNDLCVTKILNIYHNNTLKWSRELSAERSRAGLVLFTEGEIEYIFPSETIVATGGSMMLFPPNIAYRGLAKTQRVAYFVLDFKTAVEDELVEFGAPCIVAPKRFDKLCSDFSDIVSVWEQQKRDAEIKAKAFLYATLAELLSHGEQNSSKQETNDILAYIFDHYIDSDITVMKICKEFYISESQLRRNIQKVTGLTPNEYITSLRLNRAKRELICTHKNIKQIAYECGFSSEYYFSRCFHLHECISPKEYRQCHQGI